MPPFVYHRCLRIIGSQLITTLRRLLLVIPFLLLALLTFVAVGNLAGLEVSPWSKLVHFSPYWSIVAMLLLAFFALRRRWLWAACSILLGLGFGAQVGILWVAPAPLSPASTTAASPPITVMAFNVFARNQRHSEVLAALQAARPDVLYVTEMNPAWHKALAPLSQIYPHRHGERSNVLWSLFPLEQTQRVSASFENAQSIIQSSGGAMPPLSESLRAGWFNPEILAITVHARGRRLRIVGIHPPVPGSAPRMHIQRATALLCQRELRADPRAEAQVLLGDFNTTPFSPTFRFILAQTGLRDSARGFGYKPTWGPRLPREPWLPWLGIPIDHVLVSPNVSVLEREVGPALGSDHLWVKATLQW